MSSIGSILSNKCELSFVFGGEPTIIELSDGIIETVRGLTYAGMFAFVVGLVTAVLQYLARYLRRRKRPATAWATVRAPFWLATAAFLLALIPALGISLFMDACGNTNVTEVPSPDGSHMIVVYDFDCGATTDFSLDVSLLRGGMKLPRHDHPEFLYSRYHQRPQPSGPSANFAVSWRDERHVTVEVADLGGEERDVTRDGVLVSLRSLR